MGKRIILSVLSLMLCAEVFSTTFFPSRTDFRDEQIYFVITTRFYDGDASNNTYCWDGLALNEGDPSWRGDFKGLIEKLDYIKALGFTAVWITPVVENASGFDYHGYHALNFSKVDHRYESEDVSFQTLIDEAHKRGMKIILDIVLNHTGNYGETNLCKLFTRDPDADQSDFDACMKPFTQSEGGSLPDNYKSLNGDSQYKARLSKMKNSPDETGQKKNNDSHNHYHHYGSFNWDDPTRWWGQIAGDCVDLNTENPAVYNYLIKCYNTFIAMGVDGFRIDTGGHIPRLVFNHVFNPAFHAAAEQAKDKRGGTPFYMFAEVCTRYTTIWYREHPNLSALYYTWKESKDYDWDESPETWNDIVAYEGDMCNTHTNHKSCQQHGKDDLDNKSAQPTSQNALLSGNDYHTPDYSQASGLNIIDFNVHHCFETAEKAWEIAKPDNDKYYNDATWNVVYVDSHDYAPNGAPEDKRYSKPQVNWAENLCLMFTFRGIPCLYYGSEIEFKKGKTIDMGPYLSLRESGRAYFGGYIKGEINTTDFAEYSDATGNLAQTLSHPLARHIQRLSRIRMAVPALRKGQYSVSGCKGKFAFKRRYTDEQTDSYVLVSISGNATFTGILNGTYTDCITGDIQTVTDNTLSVSCSGQGNMRVYVLSTEKSPAPGKIGDDGKYLYETTPKTIDNPVWDGTQEELVGVPGEPEEPQTPCLDSLTQMVSFFKKSDEFASSIYCYMWQNANGKATQLCGSWPGKKATSLGGGQYKYALDDETLDILKGNMSNIMIIWNDGGSNQTKDLQFVNHGMYEGKDKGSISQTSIVDILCEDVVVNPDDVMNTSGTVSAGSSKILIDGRLYILVGDKMYNIYGMEVSH